MKKKTLAGCLVLIALLGAAVLWWMAEPTAPLELAALEEDADDVDADEEDDGDADTDEEDADDAGDDAGDEPAASRIPVGRAGQDSPGSPAPAARAAQPRGEDGPIRTAAPPLRLDFVRWQQANDLFSAEVPRGWRVEGHIDPQGLDKGAFIIQGYSPDGRSMFTFAHNWQWFMEYQYGPYRPGTATVETLIVPGLAANLPQLGLTNVRVGYRGPNKRFQLRDPFTGLPLVSDQGTLGVLAVTRRGEVLAGTLMGETLYMPTPGSPGLWGLRIFSGGLAPAGSREQAEIQAIQTRLANTLELSPEFRRIWAQSHDHTVARMREYSRDMGRVFERYLASARRSNARPGKDPMEGWAEMMRGGHYERDERTGEEHWVGNNNAYWWKNDQGDIVGNNTGVPPATHGNWYGLGR